MGTAGRRGVRRWKSGGTALFAVASAAAGCGGSAEMTTHPSIWCAGEALYLEAAMPPQPLENGILAALYTSRALYRRADSIGARMDLEMPRGTPLGGRALEVLAVDASGGGGTPLNFGFTATLDRPGHYESLLQVPSSWPSVSLVVAVSETGDPNNPGVNGVAQRIVNHSAPAAAYYLGSVGSGALGLTLPTMVHADVPGRADVRLDLQRTDGSSVGWAATNANLPAGGGVVEVPVPSGPANSLAQTGELVVARTALMFNGVCSDLSYDAVPVTP